MGFLSGIVSGISKVASFVGTTVSKAVSGAFKVASATLSSLATTGGFIGSIATGANKLLGMASAFMAGSLGSIVGPIIGDLVIQAIGKAVSWVAKKIGIVKEDDKVDEIGYRLEEASKHEDWEKREVFGSFSEYHEYLKEKIPDSEIDQKKLKENRIGYTSLGISVLKDGIGTKLGLDIPIDFLIEIGKCKLDGSELNALLNEFSAKSHDLSLFRQYLKGELRGNMRRAVEDSIFNALKSIYPEKSDESLRVQISSMREVARDDSKILQNYESELESLKNKDQMSQTAEDVPKVVNLEKGGKLS